MNFDKIANQLANFFKGEGPEKLLPEFINAYYSYKFDTFNSEDFYIQHIEIAVEDNISFIMARKEETIYKSFIYIDKILFSNKIYRTILVPKEVMSNTNTKGFILEYLEPICKFIADEYICKYLNYNSKYLSISNKYETIDNTNDLSLDIRISKLLEIKVALLLFGYSELKDFYKVDILKILRDNNLQDPITMMLLLEEL